MKRITIYFILLFYSLLSMAQEKRNEFEELAQGYYNQGKLVQAAEFYSKAGYAYWNKNNNEMAIASFQKAYDLFSNQKNISASIAVANNLGLLFLDDQKYNNAYTAFSNVLKYARETKNIIEIFNALINVGTVSVELSNFDEAITKTSEAVGLAKELKSLKNTAKCYSLLAESYEKKGDASNAYKYFELYSSIDKEIKAKEMEDVKQMSDEEINKAHETKRVTEIELKIKKGELKLTQDSLSVSEKVAYERQMQIELRNEQLTKKEIQLRYELHLRRTLIFGIIITVVFLVILGFLLVQKLRDNRMLRLQKEEISEQRNKLDIQNKKITDSIHYGLRIQQAMLPDINEYNKFESFIIYRPKDIVSGDFYWFREIETENIVYLFIAVVDCTGHGVPGAFMSMIGHRLLSEIIVVRKEYQPAHILELANSSIKKELDQNHTKSSDGMDLALCRISMVNNKCSELTFAGAKRPAIVYKLNEEKFITLEGNRKGVGGFLSDETKPFTDKKMDINTGDMLFIYSDGIIDQQNTERVRFGTNRFLDVLNDNKTLPMAKIKTAIETTFDFYAMHEEQRDDITVVGLKFN